MFWKEPSTDFILWVIFQMNICIFSAHVILFHFKWRLDFILQKLYIWGHVSLAGILNNGQ